jgi:hypothetical protein
LKKQQQRPNSTLESATKQRVETAAATAATEN